MTITEIDEKFMREALAEARAAAAVGEVPIGAVVVRDGEIVARAHNRRELDQDPSAHAEFAALCAAAQALGRWRLSDCTVYVTLEPCCMCAGLMVNARVGRCVYGASDAKAGALGSLYDLNADSRLNHRFNVATGVLADECREVLSGYFSGLRGTDGTGCGCGADLDAHAAHAAALAGAGEDADAAVDFGPACRRPRRVLLAIDSFKGSVSSAQAEAAVAEGVRRVWPDAQVATLPLADGGEGTLDAVAACGGELVTCEVAGPLGERVPARMLVDVERESAVIEMAEAAGIGYSPCTESSALAASTYGVGELMLHAVRAGAKTIYIGLGGSATNDGGCGAAAAMGVRFRNAAGEEFVPVGATIPEIAAVDCSETERLLAGISVEVMCDIDNPMCGDRGAAAVFGPQKGADGAMVQRLDAALDHLAKILARDLKQSVADLPGAGAAGGFGGGAAAFFGAALRPGIEVVLDLVRFDEQLKDCNLVITGEGRMDGQSLGGKVPVGVSRRAKQKGVPVVAIVGIAGPGIEPVYVEGITAVFTTNREARPFAEICNRAEADYRRTLTDLMRLVKALSA